MADDHRLPAARRAPPFAAPVPTGTPVPGDQVQEYLARLLVNAALPQYRDRVLDVACGQGYVLLELEHRVGIAGRLVGIDGTPEALAQVRGWQASTRLRRVELYAMDPQRLEFPAASFTLVTCGLALPHLPDPLAALWEMHRVLRPGGWVALTVPHPESGAALREALARRLGGRLALPSPDSPQWDESSIASLLAQAGFPTIHVQVVRQTTRYTDAAQWWQAQSAASGTALVPVPALDPGLRRALDTWQDPATPPGFAVPLVTTVALARRGSGTR